jgi:para-nitrobenzyl esterase
MLRGTVGRCVLCALALMAMPMPMPAAAAGRPGGGDPVVHTRQGTARGLTADGADKFLGLPYAAPPVGALRWRPPAAPARWRGTRSATSYASRCPQLASSNGAGSENEDCLYLNVFRPAGAARERAARLPVLFWIHGGGFINGSGDQHDGALLARTNHVVVVSINYRLGVFGFLALPSLDREAPDAASGNYGLLDQEAALRWTRANIAAFGGDPGRVAIAGESAGGFAVCALLASPRARGLFDAAVIQSGSCISQTRESAETGGAAFAAAAGCPDPATAAACLRDKPAGALLGVAPATAAAVTVGGATLPLAPADAVASGRFTRVPVINGANHDEGRTFAQGFADLTQQQYEAFVQSSFGADAPRVLERYPWSAFPSPYTAAYAIGAIWTDSGQIGGIGGCATLRLTRDFDRWTPTFAYQFDDRNAPGLNHDHPGYQWGAGHAMELAYMWPSFDNGIPLAAQFTTAQRQLAQEMVRYWGAFTRWRAPIVPGQALWPPHRGTGRILSLRPGGATTTISDGEYAAEHNCDLWDALGG